MARLFKILVLFLIVAAAVTGAYFWLQGRKEAEPPFKLVEVERGGPADTARGPCDHNRTLIRGHFVFPFRPVFASRRRR